MRGLAIAAVMVAGLFVAMPASGHEFWIDPVARLDEPGPVATDLRVGEFFKGDAYPYVSSGFNSLRVSVRGATSDIAGNEGDYPAVQLDRAEPGLNVIAFDGRPNSVTFTDPAKFLTYLETEGLHWALDAHRARGLPMTGFTELFSRNVKTLVQVGPVGPEDHDVAMGMPLELVAEANPFASPVLDSLRVRLFWQGKPLAGTQVSIFHATDSVRRSTTITDAEGNVTIPAGGGGRFLINAVHLREAAAESGAAWESHWASLTFDLGRL